MIASSKSSSSSCFHYLFDAISQSELLHNLNYYKKSKPNCSQKRQKFTKRQKTKEGVNFLPKKFTPLLFNPILQKFLFRQLAPVLHAQNLLNQLRGFWLFFIQNIGFLYFFHRGFYLLTVISVYGGQHISAGYLIAHFLM